MAKHFKPLEENSFNTAKNTRWLAVNRKTPDPTKLVEIISLDDLPEGCYGFRVDGDSLTIHIADLFYKGVERVYIFDKDQLHYNFDEES